MELACKDADFTSFVHRVGLSFLLRAYDRECSVPTDVVECIDLSLSVLDDEEVVASNLESHILARLSQALGTFPQSTWHL